MSAEQSFGPAEPISLDAFIAENASGIESLPPVRGHAYDTSVDRGESARPDHGNADIVDLRELPSRQAIGNLPDGAVLRGTVRLRYNGEQHMVTAEAVTARPVPGAGPADRYVDHVLSLPIKCDAATYAQFQQLAARRGLLGVIVDMRLNQKDRVGEGSDPIRSGTIEQVYASERLFDGPEAPEPGQAIVLEGYVAAYDSGQDYHPPRTLSLQTALGPKVIDAGGVTGTPLAGQYHPSVLHGNVSPPVPLRGDLLQVRAYAAEERPARGVAFDFNVSPSQAFESRAMRDGSAPAFYLVEPGRERWDAAHETTTDFELALGEFRQAATPEAAREAYGKLLFMRRNTDTRSRHTQPFLLTSAELATLREAWDASILALLPPEQLPFGASLKDCGWHVDRASALFGVNLLGMSPQELGQLVDSVSRGQRLSSEGRPDMAALLAIVGAVAPDLHEEKLEGRSGLITSYVPSVLRHVTYGQAMSEHEADVVSAALSAYRQLPMSRGKDRPRTMFYAYSSVLATLPEQDIIAYGLDTTIMKNVFEVLTHAVRFKPDSGAHRLPTTSEVHTTADDIAEVWENTVVEAAGSWMPGILNRLADIAAFDKQMQGPGDSRAALAPSSFEPTKQQRLTRIQELLRAITAHQG